MIGAAMTVTSTILLLCVLGVIALGLGVDVAALATWLHSRWKAWTR
jgi:hypothetical protein